MSPAPAGEVEALVLAARRRLEGVDAERFRAAATAGLDWDTLFALARRHGLLPLLVRHVEALCPEAPPAATRELARSVSESVARYNLLLLGELFRVLDRLAAEDILGVPLKGPSLAVSVYGDLSLREFTDLDVLVPESDAFRARAVLEAGGYRPTHWLPAHAEPAVLRTGNAIALDHVALDTCLEIHWRFFPRHFRFPLEETGPLERLEAVEIQGRRLPRLSAADRLLFLTAHGFRHAWQRLEWLAGVAELIRDRPDLDWDGAIGRARRLGGRRMVGLGLALAAGELDAPVPVEALRATLDPKVEDLAARVRARWRAGETTPLPRLEETRFRLRGRERRRDRIAYVVGVVATPSEADWRVARLGRGLSVLYYPIRALRLATKYAARAVRSAWPGRRDAGG